MNTAVQVDGLCNPNRVMGKVVGCSERAVITKSRGEALTLPRHLPSGKLNMGHQVSPALSSSSTDKIVRMGPADGGLTNLEDRLADLLGNISQIGGPTSSQRIELGSLIFELDRIKSASSSSVSPKPVPSEDSGPSSEMPGHWALSLREWTNHPAIHLSNLDWEWVDRDSSTFKVPHDAHVFKFNQTQVRAVSAGDRFEPISLRAPCFHTFHCDSAYAAAIVRGMLVTLNELSTLDPPASSATLKRMKTEFDAISGHLSNLVSCIAIRCDHAGGLSEFCMTADPAINLAAYRCPCSDGLKLNSSRYRDRARTSDPVDAMLTFVCGVSVKFAKNGQGTLMNKEGACWACTLDPLFSVFCVHAKVSTPASTVLFRCGSHTWEMDEFAAFTFLEALVSSQVFAVVPKAPPSSRGMSSSYDIWPRLLGGKKKVPKVMLEVVAAPSKPPRPVRPSAKGVKKIMGRSSQPNSKHGKGRTLDARNARTGQTKMPKADGVVHSTLGLVDSKLYPISLDLGSPSTRLGAGSLIAEIPIGPTLLYRALETGEHSPVVSAFENYNQFAIRNLVLEWDGSSIPKGMNGEVVVLFVQKPLKRVADPDLNLGFIAMKSQTTPSNMFRVQLASMQGKRRKFSVPFVPGAHTALPPVALDSAAVFLYLIQTQPAYPMMVQDGNVAPAPPTALAIPMGRFQLDGELNMIERVIPDPTVIEQFRIQARLNRQAAVEEPTLPNSSVKPAIGYCPMLLDVPTEFATNPSGVVVATTTVGDTVKIVGTVVETITGLVFPEFLPIVSVLVGGAVYLAQVFSPDDSSQTNQSQASLSTAYNESVGMHAQQAVPATQTAISIVGNVPFSAGSLPPVRVDVMRAINTGLSFPSTSPHHMGAQQILELIGMGLFPLVATLGLNVFDGATAVAPMNAVNMTLVEQVNVDHGLTLLAPSPAPVHGKYSSLNIRPFPKLARDWLPTFSIPYHPTAPAVAVLLTADSNGWDGFYTLSDFDPATFNPNPYYSGSVFWEPQSLLDSASVNLAGYVDLNNVGSGFVEFPCTFAQHWVLNTGPVWDLVPYGLGPFFGNPSNSLIRGARVDVAGNATRCVSFLSGGQSAEWTFVSPGPTVTGTLGEDAWVFLLPAWFDLHPISDWPDWVVAPTPLLMSPCEQKDFQGEHLAVRSDLRQWSDGWTPLSVNPNPVVVRGSYDRSSALGGTDPGWGDWIIPSALGCLAKAGYLNEASYFDSIRLWEITKLRMAGGDYELVFNPYDETTFLVTKKICLYFWRGFHVTVSKEWCCGVYKACFVLTSRTERLVRCWVCVKAPSEPSRAQELFQGSRCPLGDTEDLVKSSALFPDPVGAVENTNRWRNSPPSFHCHIYHVLDCPSPPTHAECSTGFVPLHDWYHCPDKVHHKIPVPGSEQAFRTFVVLDSWPELRGHSVPGSFRCARLTWIRSVYAGYPNEVITEIESHGYTEVDQIEDPLVPHHVLMVYPELDLPFCALLVKKGLANKTMIDAVLASVVPKSPLRRHHEYVREWGARNDELEEESLTYFDSTGVTLTSLPSPTRELPRVLTRVNSLPEFAAIRDPLFHSALVAHDDLVLVTNDTKFKCPGCRISASKLTHVCRCGRCGIDVLPSVYQAHVAVCKVVIPEGVLIGGDEHTCFQKSCKAKFSDLTSLLFHREHAHLCGICSKSFPSGVARVKHYNTHRGVEVSHCVGCGFIWDDKYEEMKGSHISRHLTVDHSTCEIVLLKWGRGKEKATSSPVQDEEPVVLKPPAELLRDLPQSRDWCDRCDFHPRNRAALVNHRVQKICKYRHLVWNYSRRYDSTSEFNHLKLFSWTHYADKIDGLFVVFSHDQAIQAFDTEELAVNHLIFMTRDSSFWNCPCGDCGTPDFLRAVDPGDIRPIDSQAVSIPEVIKMNNKLLTTITRFQNYCISCSQHHSSVCPVEARANGLVELATVLSPRDIKWAPRKFGMVKRRSRYVATKMKLAHSVTTALGAFCLTPRTPIGPYAARIAKNRSGVFSDKRLIVGWDEVSARFSKKKLLSRIKTDIDPSAPANMKTSFKCHSMTATIRKSRHMIFDIKDIGNKFTSSKKHVQFCPEWTMYLLNTFTGLHTSQRFATHIEVRTPTRAAFEIGVSDLELLKGSEIIAWMLLKFKQNDGHIYMKPNIVKSIDTRPIFHCTIVQIGSWVMELIRSLVQQGQSVKSACTSAAILA